MVAPTVVALIPARKGSVRIPGKNMKPLAGYPLLAYTLAQALDTGLFGAIVVSSDDGHALDLARQAGRRASVVALPRPQTLATSTSPDIEWVAHALRGRPEAAFCLLRPTAPFRRPETIRDAWKAFQDDSQLDSLRAVRLTREHPGKMWRVIAGTRMVPLLPFGHEGQAPWHSSPTQTLPPVYTQTATLEIAWTRVVTGIQGGTIAGDTIRPFLVTGPDAFDINSPEDWVEAERIAADGVWPLPRIAF